jgi:DNA-binding NarL/FixJ family response regulator
VVFSERPALHAFFATVARDPVHAPVTVAAARAAPLDDVDAAVVDVALDRSTAIDVCAELRRRRDNLAIAAVVCCPHAVNDWTLQALLASGVNAVLDLQSSAEEAQRLLQNVGRGASILHVELWGRRQPLHEVLAPSGRGAPVDSRLLKLVARGLPDHEIAADLHLSPHTVKHRIEQLRRRIDVRNRIELAAWAGSQGFYS